MRLEVFFTLLKKKVKKTNVVFTNVVFLTSFFDLSNEQIQKNCKSNVKIRLLLAKGKVLPKVPPQNCPKTQDFFTHKNKAQFEKNLFLAFFFSKLRYSHAYFYKTITILMILISILLKKQYFSKIRLT